MSAMRTHVSLHSSVAGWTLLLLPFLLAACAGGGARVARAPGVGATVSMPWGGRTGADAPPEPMREFRAVWIATVSNIDWPSSPGQRPSLQRDELARIIERAAALHLNAVILQVRPAADALYPSKLEPWSGYLTGEQGKAPDPPWDPLAFAVREAHAHGLELHAWFNPYRARHPSARSDPAPTHISVTHPELVKRYGAYLWMDPGEPAVRDYTTAVVLDVVRRYDIDGVHIDDYFYPYRERGPNGAELDFPDSASWSRYVEGGGTLSRDDWRRHNVDVLVERLYREIKREKPWVQFGISPYGIWRPGHPPQISGFDPYEQIYADSRKWLEAGWVDYITPQLYFPIAQTPQSYPVLLGWWVKHNPRDRHLWPGLFSGRVRGDGQGWPVDEVLGQIYVARGMPGVDGVVLFSARSLMDNPGGVADTLGATAFKAPALVPATPWLDGPSPAPPGVSLDDVMADGRGVLRFQPGDSIAVRVWVVRVRRRHGWSLDVLPGWRRSVSLAAAGPVLEAAVSAVDRLGGESPVTCVRLVDGSR